MITASSHTRQHDRETGHSVVTPFNPAQRDAEALVSGGMGGCSRDAEALVSGGMGGCSRDAEVLVSGGMGGCSPDAEVLVSGGVGAPSSTRWQADLADAITTPEALVAALGLERSLLAPAHAAAAGFRLRVPRSYVARMRHGDPNDPLLRQVLPVESELQDVVDYVTDPLGEHAALRAPGLLQKYRGRALMITTSACAVHCRYCFRREFPYSEQTSEAPRWSAALAEIANDTSLEEVILSGGDPLSLSDARLTSLTDALARIPHIRRLRVHTRQPVVLPSRVDEGLAGWLRSVRLPTVFVLHVNHPNEIDTELRSACAKLRASGVTLLNQSVLLRGINDDVDVLAELSRRLFDAGVLPYYLHVLDHVRGAAHFAVPDQEARTLAGALAARLSGYLVPRLVREVYGAPAKVTLAPQFPV